MMSFAESGDYEEVHKILDELSKERERGLFCELGKLTRDLHNALANFEIDSRMIHLTKEDIPDAKDRLRHVIKMTDDSANRTLGAVEESMPVCSDLRAQAGDLDKEWERFMRRDMEAEEFRGLCRKIQEFFPAVKDGSSKVYDRLSTVLMAQDFQDLTGQILNRVISLVEEVEDNLVNLIRISGKKFGAPSQEAEAKRGAADLEGPQIPGKKHPDAVSGQDEVDELLSSLGF